MLRQGLELAVVAADAGDGRGRMAPLQPAAGLQQVLGADVERHVGRRVPGGLDRLQQRTHLAGAAGPELQQGAGPHGCGDGGGLGLQQGCFGGGEAVFGLLADQIEQARALGVV